MIIKTHSTVFVHVLIVYVGNYRYDKFRKSDKKSKTGDGEENPTNVVENTNEKNNVENNTPA